MTFIIRFHKEKRKCIPDDPCMNVECAENEICNEGTCSCKNGWYQEENSGICKEKVNECLSGATRCDTHAICVDTLEYYTCECKDDYRDVSPMRDGTQESWENMKKLRYENW